MSKLILAMALTGVLIFSTFGCGGQESSDTSPVEEAAEVMEDAKADAEEAAETMEGSDMKDMEGMDMEGMDMKDMDMKDMEGSEAK
jgi:hypothetical protein